MGFSFKLRMPQNSFSAGAPPQTPLLAGGAYDAPPDPFPIPLLLDLAA